MGIGLASKFALRNLKANKIFVIPFILSSSVMIALFNIMEVIIENDYVKNSYSILPTFIGMGIVIVGIFSFMFIIYANRFMVKRRNKEFSLYRIMGLEKKHIVRIMFIEELIIFVLISILSILGGYVMGKIIFLFVNKLTQNVIVSLSNYYFSDKAAIYTMIYIIFTFVVVFITNIKSISTASPIELLSKQYSGDKEPKARYFITFIGLFILASGYFIAIVTKGNLKSLGMFFVAAILVIIATYILFVTLSIVILKILKKNEKIYYKAENFISISGMIYRMRGNALGLASIAVLCTGVIVTLSATFTIYSSMQYITETVVPREYKIETRNVLSYKDTEKVKYYRKELEKKVYDSVEDKNDIKDMFIAEEIYLPALKVENSLVPYDHAGNKKGKNIFILLNKDSDFSRETGKNVKLADNELIYGANNKSIAGFENIVINGKRMRATEDNKEIKVPANIAIESIKMVVNSKVYDQIIESYKIKGARGDRFGSGEETIAINWSLKKTPKHYFRDMKKLADASNLEFKSRASVSRSSKELYGGILFLGVIIGTIFVIGTVLITYYKQLSEGYEDRKNYQIMKKVGLPDSLIKKTAEKQIIWMFFIPLIVALIHSLVASKIVYQLLQLFGITSYMAYAKNIAIVIAVFSVIYLVIFKVTSNIYYKIVK